jgi:hypothetical protein
MEEVKDTVKVAVMRQNDVEVELHNNITEVRDLFNKNNCFDIFKNSMIENEHIYEPMLNRQRI